MGSAEVGFMKISEEEESHTIKGEILQPETRVIGLATGKQKGSGLTFLQKEEVVWKEQASLGALVVIRKKEVTDEN